ncbi:MAG: hypothetical protein WC371_00750 [Parachlamydiales bacterium]|jgi:hypothetical protein
MGELKHRFSSEQTRISDLEAGLASYRKKIKTDRRADDDDSDDEEKPTKTAEKKS